MTNRIVEANLLILLCFSLLIAQEDKLVAPRISCPCPCEHLANNLQANDIDFYPIGWSPNGRLAWIKENIVFDVGEFEFVIQDMVTDDILTRYVSQQFHTYADSVRLSGSQVTAEDFWALERRQIQELMNTYMILGNNLQLMSFPILSDRDTVTVVLQKRFRRDFDNERIDADSVLADFSVEVASSSRGTKRVYFSESLDFERAYGVDISVCGYIKNPYEERIAILLAKRRHHPYKEDVVHMFFIGAHLKIGW